MILHLILTQSVQDIEPMLLVVSAVELREIVLAIMVLFIQLLQMERLGSFKLQKKLIAIQPIQDRILTMAVGLLGNLFSLELGKRYGVAVIV